MHKVTIVLDIEMSEEIQDLLDKVANRIYTMDKVEVVTAAFLEKQPE